MFQNKLDDNKHLRYLSYRVERGVSQDEMNKMTIISESRERWSMFLGVFRYLEEKRECCRPCPHPNAAWQAHGVTGKTSPVNQLLNISEKTIYTSGLIQDGRICWKCSTIFNAFDGRLKCIFHNFTIAHFVSPLPGMHSTGNKALIPRCVTSGWDGYWKDGYWWILKVVLQLNFFLFLKLGVAVRRRCLVITDERAFFVYQVWNNLKR